MIPAIKAEFRKIFSVRSTYVILALALAVEVLFAFYAAGFKSSAADLRDTHFLASQVTSAVSFLSIFIALIGVLLVTHEYRYNTILYTLTSAKRRTTVLVAKILTVSVFAILASVLLGVLSPLLALAGLHFSHHDLIHQVIPFGDLLWRSIFGGWGFAMLTLIFASIIRNQVGALVAMFLIPGTVEQLLGLLLKKNQVYLPFSSLAAVLDHNQISYQRAALVAAMYIVVGWIIAWVLFLRRDAN